MANSSAVVDGELQTHTDYNDLRSDVLSTTTGHRHDGTNGRVLGDIGASTITTTGVITGGTVEATTDTAASDNAAMGHTDGEGLILTGQGTTNDVTIKNDADAQVISIPTGTNDVRISGGLSLDGADAVTAGLSLTGGIDLKNSGSLLNVGGAGNDWTANDLKHKGSGQVYLERTTGGTDDLSNVLNIKRTSSGDVDDGFGVLINFRLEDDAAVERDIGQLGFRRDGADNTAEFLLRTYNGGTANEAFKITPLGIGFFDASGDGSATVTLFDEYDDATELQRFARAQSSLIPTEEREEHLARMVALGIFERNKASSSGYMLGVQPVLRLVAGGIYQNRAYIDSLETRIQELEVTAGVQRPIES